MSDLISITATPLDTAAAIAHVNHPDAGGVAVFLGTTRSETHADGRTLVALDYEAYADMATSQLKTLAHTARHRFYALRVAIIHRIGHVPIGEPSVVIAVSTPHRAEAFEACRWLIDTLKADAAIWKKEIWADGSASWVHPEK